MHTSSQSGEEKVRELLGVHERNCLVAFPIENQVKIPATAMVLHNLTRMQNGDEGWLNRQTSNICPEHFVDLPGGDNHYNNDVMSLSSQIEDGNTVRDMIALNMWNDYSHNSS